METIKFYEIIVRGNAKGGVLYAPKSWVCPIARDGEVVLNWQSLKVELRNGPYRNFNMCVGTANVISEDFKAAIQEVIGDVPDLEFLPIMATSKEYGDWRYYIMHFTKIFDVIDEDNTIYVPNSNSIIKLWLDYDKVKDLKIFNSQPYINDVIVSDDIRRLLKRKHLDDGIEFMPVYCEIKRHNNA